LSNLQKRTRTLRRKYPVDRIRYWMAMSLLKMEKVSEAQDIFESILNEAPTSYYALAARSRLMGLPERQPPVHNLTAERGVASVSASSTGDVAGAPMSLAVSPMAALPATSDDQGQSESEESLAT